MKSTIIFLFFFLFLSCQKEEFDSQITYLGVDAIKMVRLYPNSPVLMADGKAQLKFKVKAFTEIERTKVVNDEKVTYLDTMELIYDRLPQSQILIQTADGKKIENFTYTTTEGSGTTKSFVAKIGQVSSTPVEVRLIEKPVLDYGPVTIPVVFHVLSTIENRNECNGVTPEFVNKTLMSLNQVFSGTIYAAPSAVDTKVQFVLADKDPNGGVLTTPGINREDKENETTAQMKKYVTDNLLWDPAKYLNIWVYNASPYNDASKAPAYVLDNGVLIAGLKLKTVVDVSEVVFTKPEEIGITISTSSIFNTNFESVIGTFFGLLPTGCQQESDMTAGDLDFCPDTYTYQRMYSSAEKWTFATEKKDRIYYDSYNIMDEDSASSTISYDQAVRIRKVMESCPLRMMRQ
ncbi:MAG: hypothetical protein RSB69_08055 [Odoribacter sp.]